MYMLLCKSLADGMQMEWQLEEISLLYRYRSVSCTGTDQSLESRLVIFACIIQLHGTDGKTLFTPAWCHKSSALLRVFLLVKGDAPVRLKVSYAVQQL